MRSPSEHVVQLQQQNDQLVEQMTDLVDALDWSSQRLSDSLGRRRIFDATECLAFAHKVLKRYDRL